MDCRLKNLIVVRLFEKVGYYQIDYFKCEFISAYKNKEAGLAKGIVRVASYKNKTGAICNELFSLTQKFAFTWSRVKGIDMHHAHRIVRLS